MFIINILSNNRHSNIIILIFLKDVRNILQGDLFLYVNIIFLPISIFLSIISILNLRDYSAARSIIIYQKTLIICNIKERKKYITRKKKKYLVIEKRNRKPY